jgi:hypothetical protein
VHYLRFGYTQYWKNRRFLIQIEWRWSWYSGALHIRATGDVARIPPQLLLPGERIPYPVLRACSVPWKNPRNACMAARVRRLGRRVVTASECQKGTCMRSETETGMCIVYGFLYVKNNMNWLNAGLNLWLQARFPSPFLTGDGQGLMTMTMPMSDVAKSHGVVNIDVHADVNTRLGICQCRCQCLSSLHGSSQF